MESPGGLPLADAGATFGPMPQGLASQVPLGFAGPAVAATSATSSTATSSTAAPPAAVPDVTPAVRSELLNRCVNVLVAGLALMLLAPICVVVAVLIKLTSPGPVFYTQTRVGADRRGRRSEEPDAAGERRREDFGGQPFTILKFRSMRVDAEANGQAVWATKHDSRITPLGQVLRKSRLDEVPQLINVMRGEMNIVGPRPERPSIVVRLCEHVTAYPMRHRVKPGITGWAQINHSYDASIEDVRKKVAFDLEYIRTQSLWLDVKIMCLTIPVMVFKRGAH